MATLLWMLPTDDADKDDDGDVACWWCTSVSDVDVKRSSSPVQPSTWCNLSSSDVRPPPLHSAFPTCFASVSMTVTSSLDV